MLCVHREGTIPIISYNPPVQTCWQWRTPFVSEIIATFIQSPSTNLHVGFVLFHLITGFSRPLQAPGSIGRHAAIHQVCYLGLSGFSTSGPTF